MPSRRSIGLEMWCFDRVVIECWVVVVTEIGGSGLVQEVGGLGQDRSAKGT